MEYKAEKDNSIKTTIVFLPDISDPQFLVIKPGIGSHELKMNFENSALTSYGLVAESEYPELFESIASMLSKSAYAAQGFGGSETSAQNGSEQNFQLFELISDASGTRLKEVTPLSSNQ
ncbi:MAG: hypothetical protein GXY51_12535 [Bacteroidetes bacterium]|nr:hypothetical protein [Bacteroidota bacterium]